MQFFFNIGIFVYYSKFRIRRETIRRMRLLFTIISFSTKFEMKKKKKREKLFGEDGGKVLDGIND